RKYREAKDQQKDHDARIRAAWEFVTKAGLHHAMTRILREVWHWPSWIRRQDARSYVYDKELGVEGLQAHEIESKNSATKRISFNFGGESYTFEFEEKKRYFEGSKFGSIRFFYRGELVLSLQVTHNLDKDREYWMWSASKVDALSPGEWAKAALEMEHRIRV